MEYFESLIEWGMWSTLISVVATGLIYQVFKHRLDQDEIGKYFTIGCLIVVIFFILMIFGVANVIEDVAADSGDFI